jgi:hypothetical protein
MLHNGYRRAYYLLQAEEAEDLAELFMDDLAREKWLDIARAYRFLAGQQEARPEPPG